MVNLVEPRLKRISFLKHIIRTCELDHIGVHPVRLDPKIPLADESYHNSIVSRAVTSVPQFLNLCVRYCEEGKRVICMKGPRYREELAEIEQEQKSWRLSELREYCLPFSGASRALLCFLPQTKGD